MLVRVFGNASHFELNKQPIYATRHGEQDILDGWSDVRLDFRQWQIYRHVSI